MSERAATSRLTLAVVQSDATATVRCSGRLVAGVGDLLYNQVRDLTPSSRHIVLDFSELAIWTALAWARWFVLTSTQIGELHAR